MDAAAVTRAYLGEATTIPWYHDAPSHPPEEYGTITRDGGPKELVTDRPILTAIVHATRRGRAADLADEAEQAIIAMPWSVDNVFSAEVMGNYYDPMDGRPRHRITAQITTND